MKTRYVLTWYLIKLQSATYVKNNVVLAKKLSFDNNDEGIGNGNDYFNNNDVTCFDFNV